MNELDWRRKIANKLVGKTIKDVFYLNPREAEDIGWYSRPIVLRLDDDTFLIPMMDDEGNDGGAMSYTDDELPTIPVMR